MTASATSLPSIGHLLMGICDQERRTPHPDLHTNPSHYDEAGSGTYVVLAKPRTFGQSGSRVGYPGGISPPPLKRQRTAHEDRNLGTQLSAYNNLKRYDPAGSSVLSQSFGGQTAFSKDAQSKHEHVPKLFQISQSFSTLVAHREHIDQDARPTSSLSYTYNSRRLSKPGQWHKPSCRICAKTTTTSYNPIIVCPGCSRSYHDSCRNPPLSPGAKSERWRCSSCLAHCRMYKRSKVSSAVAASTDSVVRDIFKPRSRHIFPITIRPITYHQVPLTIRTEAPDLHTSGANMKEILNRPREAHRIPQQRESKLIEHVEVLNTPTLSRPLALLGSSPKKHHYVEATLDGRSKSQKLPPPEALRSVCCKMHISIGSTVESTECQNCRNKLPIVRLETSETPVDTILHSIPTGNSGMGVESSVVSRNDSGLIANSNSDPSSRTTLKLSPGKVSDEEMSWTNTASQEPILGSICTSAARTTHGVGMIAVLEPEMVKQLSTPPDSASLQPPYTEIQHEEPLSVVPDTPTTLRVSALTDSLPLTFDCINTNDKHTPTQQPQADEVNDVNGENASRLEPDLFQEDTLSAPDSPSCTELDSENPALPMPEKRLTNREFAIIALVAANGSSMTAAQIIDWLVQHFSCLRKGQGAWEGSLRSVLSNSPEFHGAKDVLAHKRRKVYSFGNATYRARFEAEYRQYVANPPPRNVEKAQSQRQVRSATMGMPKGSHRKAIKSAPSCRAHVLTPEHPHSSFVPSLHITPRNQDEGTDPSSNPSERFTALQGDTLNKPTESERETSFHRIQARFMKPSIETMTPEEKAMKIAEIQARPSRKRFFGPDYRLGHVLRQGRQDIHDESDGAWDPKLMSNKEKRLLWEGQSLREKFNLPENAVPMNDGQELAFRDGTLLNGRLPRPRQIYRVGKVFGSDLTTRHS